jgi:hypothetical protein
MLLFALYVLTPIRGAIAKDDVQVSDRLIYLNESLVGAYATCVHPEDGALYLDETFFERVKLQRFPSPLICEGRSFWRAKVILEKLDGQGMGKAKVSSSDYEQPMGKETPTSYASSLIPVGSPVNLFALQHEVGFWYEQTKTTNMTLGLSGRRYSSVGLFALDGYASTVNGQFHGYLRDASWRRTFPEKGFSARLGLNTINNIGTSTTLYGLVLESNKNIRPLNEVRTIQGFADVPGKIQIRARGILIKEVPISAGYYNLPLSDLTSNASSNGQYALTLVDDSGREVRTWNEFIPMTPQLLPIGEANWKLFLGQVKSNSVMNKVSLSGADNIGAGLLYRYGINKYLTGELSTIIGKSVRGNGLVFDFVPAPWLSLSAGSGRSIGVNSTMPARNAYWGVDLHTESMAWYSGYTQQNCILINSSTGNEHVCKNLRHSLQFQAGRLGRLSFLTSSSIDSRPKSSSIGFSWSFAAPKGWGVSIYGSKQRTDNVHSFVIGLMGTVALDKGHLMSSISMNGSDSSNEIKSYSTSYTQATNNETQYSMGADVSQQPYRGPIASFNGFVNYRPWHGAYQTNVRVRNDGSYSVGFNETGALVVVNNNIVPLRTAEGGIAVLRLNGLGNRTVEDNNGIIKSITNAEGYAAVSAYVQGATSSLRVAAEELPTNIKLPNVLVGRNPDPWTATYWEPSVRKVRQGWLKLVYESGNSVPTGSMLDLTEPAYVLESGEVFIEDLPDDVASVLVKTPGNRSRCKVQLPPSLELRAQYKTEIPTLFCN